MSSGTRGFSRDRTAAFLRHRGASTSAGGGLGGRGGGGSLGLGGEADSASLLGNDGANGASVAQIAANVPPAWVDVQEEVARYMEQIRLKMSQLSKAHKKAALPTFDDMGSKDQDVEVLTRAITNLFKRSEMKLKTLATHQGDAGDTKVRQNVMKALAAELQQLSMDFRKQQKGYLNKIRKQQEVVGGKGGLIDFDVERGDDPDDLDMGFSESQLLRARESDLMSIEREKEVLDIVRSVEDLAQVMRDLSVLVIDQGSIVDRIDYNMEQVTHTVGSPPSPPSPPSPVRRPDGGSRAGQGGGQGAGEGGQAPEEQPHLPLHPVPGGGSDPDDADRGGEEDWFQLKTRATNQPPPGTVRPRASPAPRPASSPRYLKPLWLFRRFFVFRACLPWYFAGRCRSLTSWNFRLAYALTFGSASSSSANVCFRSRFVRRLE